MYIKAIDLIKRKRISSVFPLILVVIIRFTYLLDFHLVASCKTLRINNTKKEEKKSPLIKHLKYLIIGKAHLPIHLAMPQN